MGTVIALDQYRMRKDPGRELHTLLAPPPRINDGQIFSRDYSKLDGIVFAVLKIREILRYHVQTNEEWQYLALQVLDAAYHFDAGHSALLREATGSLKDYILEEMDQDNGKDMTAALLLLDLIEKAPRFRERQPAQDG
ncbi:hypothetical protein [Desulfocurvus vexinensis]|uniref:hypothetical protein n=1 Tax=Desulfocurvus vexinensis TaxID=399548 RepID=UPI00048DA193|nr:hypothetical protein [Desulfocurvus vexinensis]